MGTFQGGWKVPFESRRGRAAVKLGLRRYAPIISGVLLLASVAEATHFRYGHVTWVPRPDLGPRTAEFVVTNAWRRNQDSGPGPFTGPGGLPGVGDIIVENQGQTAFNFGDGVVTPILRYKVTAIDVANNWMLARALQPGTNNENLLHAYANNGPWLARIDDTARLSTLQNCPDCPYRVETQVRFDIVNSSPVSSLLPIINAPINTIFNFPVPALDSDGDALTWRFATSPESAISDPIGPVGGTDATNAPTINSGTGVVTWNTTGGTALGFLYCLQVVVEERRSNVLIGKSSVDFLLLIVAQGNPPTCMISPPGPFTVLEGSPLSYMVSGTDPNAGQTLTLNTGGLPSGATQTPPLPTSGPNTGVSSTFNWTPSTSQAGAYVVSYSVTDNFNLQTLCSASISVIECTGPEHCNDGNPCTQDICNANNLCENPFESLGTACDLDSNLCTIDQCNGVGQCVFLKNKKCQLPNPPCEGGAVCNPGTGQCEDQPDAVMSTPCQADMSQCTIDHCDGNGQCVFLQNVTCQPASPPCEGGEVCNPANGQCVAQPDAPLSTPCQADGTQCTNDHCDGSGQCVFLSDVVCPGPTGPCDAGTACTPATGACDPLPDPVLSTFCELDGDLCTDDHCDGMGSCVRLSTRTCPGSTGPCDAGEQCNPSNGLCETLADPPMGKTCELDGDLCTLDECDGTGSCVHVSDFVCPPPTGTCDAGSVCNPATGSCDDLLDPAAGTSCERDGNLCTIDECDGNGSCVFVGDVQCPGPTGLCDAGTVCNPMTGGCDDIPDPQLSTPCEADGNLCTNDHCDGMGGCVFLSDVVCQPPDPPCEAGAVCNPGTGMCEDLVDAPEGAFCEVEGDLCSTDHCNGDGECVFLMNVVCAGPVPPCEAGQECNPGTGNCDDLADAQLSTPCERDFDLCTIDHCDGMGSCVQFDQVECAPPVLPCDPGEICFPGTGECGEDEEHADTDGDPCGDAEPLGLCDQGDVCEGHVCDPNYLPAGTLCRPVDSGDSCDLPEYCSGTTGDCPPDDRITACVPGDGCCPSGCGVEDNDCFSFTPIPTVSEWGLAVLALVLLIGGKLYFGLRRSAPGIG